MITTLAITVLLSASAMPAQSQLDFMEGYWLSCDDGREVFEVWTQAYDKLRLGQGATLEKGRASFEQFQIAPFEGGLAYFAQPQGRPATVFKLVEVTPTKAVFSNPEHDFPQSIIYERKGDTLTGRIEGKMNDQNQVFSWRYHRAELNTRCPKAK